MLDPHTVMYVGRRCQALDHMGCLVKVCCYLCYILSNNWYTCSHAQPTYCNVCRETLSGVTSHGLSFDGKLLHNWYTCSYSWPTYCNVCREVLSRLYIKGFTCEGNFSRVLRKPVFLVSGQVRHKPVCTITEYG